MFLVEIQLLGNNHPNYKNGKENIIHNRKLFNQKNLEQDIILWTEICKMNNADINFDNNEKCPFTIKNEDSEYTTEEKNNLNKKIFSTYSRLIKNTYHYGIENINFEHIKEMCQKYLDCDDWLKISFCKDSTRQQVDEKVQRKLLQSYSGWEAMNLPASGEKSILLYDAKLNPGKKKIKGHKTMDTKLTNNNLIGYVLQKYFGVEGGHQDNVDSEVDNFVNEANKYCEVNNDNNIFLAQIDGDEGERHIQEYRNIITNNDRIFVGNSEYLIDILSDYND